MISPILLIILQTTSFDRNSLLLMNFSDYPGFPIFYFIRKIAQKRLKKPQFFAEFLSSSKKISESVR